MKKGIGNTSINILLIEDKPADVLLIRRMLSTIVNFSIEQVARLSAGLERLDKGGIDVVIMDIVLSDSEGIEAIKRVYAAYPDVPLVVLTGFPDEETGMKAIYEGAQDYLVKGRINADALLRILRYSIERKRAGSDLKFSEARLESLYKLSLMKDAAEQEITDFALEEGVRLTGSRIGYLHFFNEDQKTVRLYSWSKEVLKTCTALKETHYLLEKAGVWLDCVRQRSPVIHNDYQNFPDKKGYPEGHSHIVRHMSIPIFDGEKIVAVAGVGNKEQPYNESDTRQLYLFMSEMWKLLMIKRAEEERQKLHNLESLGVIAGGIAHDFNNLLTVILGNIALAKMHLPSDYKSFNRLIQAEKACEDARKLSDQLLTFAKRGEPSRETASIAKIIEETAGSSLSGSNVTTNFIFSGDLSYVMVDVNQIRQAFNNLFINAQEAMPEGGVITVTAKNTSVRTADNLQLKEGSYLKISIEDQGVGIPEENLAKIFDPYFSTKERWSEKGMGLGLSISHSIITKHAGTITVESRVGGGTTFHIYLPAAEEGKGK